MRSMILSRRRVVALVTGLTSASSRDWLCARVLVLPDPGLTDIDNFHERGGYQATGKFRKVAVRAPCKKAKNFRKFARERCSPNEKGPRGEPFCHGRNAGKARPRTARQSGPARSHRWSRPPAPWEDRAWS